MTRATKARLDDLRNRWFHSIDLGDGVVTSGQKSAVQLASELRALGLPDLRGKTVLDIGAWDGYFSFAAERLGAARVVAVDHYVWSVDWAAALEYQAVCRDKGVAPEPWDQLPEVWKPDMLPGKACFDAAHEMLNSRVEPVVADFMSLDAKTFGTFDVLLFLGVLYHVQDPMSALRQVASLTEQLAVIETDVIAVPGYERFPLWDFFESNELADDSTNWWAPNVAGLQAMCRAAGFSTVEANAPSTKHRVRRVVSLGRLVRDRRVARAWR